MSKINFRFIWKKLFLGGLFTGIVLSALVFFVVLSSHFPPVAKQKLTGTMSNNNYSPSLMEAGVVVSSGTYCGYSYSDVTLNGDPNQNLIRCHSDAGVNSEQPVLVSQISGGEFCQGGGIYVSVIPEQN